ncbi:MAG: hypothetical protein IRZ16_01225 [Myxococcaceae bacterium]|nr:hypothetical protein [Myxococcaceae bacterium]
MSGSPRDNRKSASPAKKIGAGGMALAIGLIAVAIATGQLALLIPAAILAILAGAMLISGIGEAVLASLPAGLAPKDETRARIGAGANLGEGAVIEPGATVEMGATIGPGARVERGAVVRMGATVASGAVVEVGAVVGWGVEVMQNAVVGQGAVVGAGATVHPGAVVPPGMRLPPGSDWSGGVGTARSASAAGSSARTSENRTVDPRLARIDAACERIASELEQAPESVKAYLGASAQTASELRKICLGLVEREKVLRAESSAQALAFLAQERAELEQKIAAATDEGIRRSLKSAVAAIEDQQRQRAALKTSADRLDAELTRLQWTLDGMATQLVRLRTAGSEVTAGATDEVLRTVQQLHDEIDAIAEALEHVGRADVLEPIAEIAAPEPPAPVGVDRQRTR